MAWDYQNMLAKVKSTLPSSKKGEPIDAPVPVTEFRGIKCSLYGAPLEKDLEGLFFEYKEMKFPRFNANKQREFREKNGRILVIYPETNKRNQQFLITYEDPSGQLSPIIEVSNGGRACMRARQWAMLHECDFQVETDDKVVVSQSEYRQLLMDLDGRRVI
jgi:hypothetical protein